MENPNLKWMINGVQYTSILGNVHLSYKNGHLEGVIIIFSLILPFSELYMAIPDFQTHPYAVNLVLKSIYLGCVATRNAPRNGYKVKHPTGNTMLGRKMIHPLPGTWGFNVNQRPQGSVTQGIMNNVWVCLSRANLIHQQPPYII